jgi:GNAT superfamily N-acetyltransferase
VAEAPALGLRELTASTADRALLGRFYTELYAPEFPDRDERESLANMERYLALKAAGWYGQNNYHIGLMVEGDAPVAGVILDYLAEPNAGVLEFVVVATSHRRGGVGTRVMEWAEKTLSADAQRGRGTALDWIVAEINDPFRPAPVPDNVDTFARLAVWSTWGFAKLDFPYTQPALSSDQKAVDHLLLAAKTLRPDLRDAVPARLVERVVHEYLKWAMRIEQPEGRHEFQTMQRYLRARSTVETIPLARYVGRDPARPLDVHEILDANDPDLSATLGVYERAFPVGPTAVESAALRQALGRRHQASEKYAYHLWALRATAGGLVEGMTSFFTFPTAGFGGYLTLGGSLRGTSRLRPLVARIEERMLRDDLDARGWYAECRRDSPEAIVLGRVGFFEVALTYRQPRLEQTASAGAAEGAELVLLYKEFGRRYAAPRLRRDVLLESLGWVFRIVYGGAPDADERFGELGRQAATWPDATVPWRVGPDALR